MLVQVTIDVLSCKGLEKKKIKTETEFHWFLGCLDFGQVKNKNSGPPSNILYKVPNQIKVKNIRKELSIFKISSRYFFNF